MTANMEVLLTPRFFAAPVAWPVSTPEPSRRYVALPSFLPGPFSGGFPASPTSLYANAGRELIEPSIQHPNHPPSVVYVHHDWDDDVSLLQDDPDEDDAQLLPHSTYDVLAPLLDEMSKVEALMENPPVPRTVFPSTS